MPFKMVGITDERDTCELCGKTNLKRCVVLQDTDAGGIVYYGTDCAARVLYPRAHDKLLAGKVRALNSEWDSFYQAKDFIGRKRSEGWTDAQIRIRIGVLRGMPGVWLKPDGHFYAKVNDEWTQIDT